MKEFPSRITSKRKLVDVLTRIVFLPVQHHAVNYPIAYYGAFIPSMPGKLYDDPRAPGDEFNIHRLPQSHYATVIYYLLLQDVSEKSTHSLIYQIREHIRM